MVIIGANETLDLQAVLMPGERVLWSGRPIPSRHLFRIFADIFQFTFLILWTGVALTMFILSGEPGFIRADDASLVRMMMGFFVTVGSVALFLPIYRYAAAKKTVYAITDKRILIVQNLLWNRITAVYDLVEIKTNIRRDGSGSIKFINTTGFFAAHRNAAGDIKGFYGIPDVRDAEVHLHEFFAANQS